MAMCLIAMVALILGNAVLRCACYSGITISEEMSRWFFVWLSFPGGVVALRGLGRLGTEILVERLGTSGQKACLAIGQVLMFKLATGRVGDADPIIVKESGDSA